MEFKDKVKFKKFWLAGVGIILILGIVFFIIRPGIVGYGIYNQIKNSNYSIEDYGQDIHGLRLNLSVCEGGLSFYQEFNSELSEKADIYLKNFNECDEELKLTTLDFVLFEERCEEDMEEVKKGLNEKDLQINELNKDYDTLAKNLANNICCKRKIDNSNIKYYLVEDNMIICTEERGLNIECVC